MRLTTPSVSDVTTMVLSIVSRVLTFLLGEPAPHEELPPDSRASGEQQPYPDKSRPLDASGTVVTEEFTEWESEYFRKNVMIGHGGGRAPDSELDRSERYYLKVVIENPAQPSSTYHKLARMSTRRALDIRRRLVDLGYLCEARVNLSKRGRAAIVLEPTPRALELFESQPTKDES